MRCRASLLPCARGYLIRAATRSAPLDPPRAGVTRPAPGLVTPSPSATPRPPRTRARSADGLSLEHKLPLLISALLLIVIAVFGWAAYREVRESALVSATERVKRVARQLAEFSASQTARRSEALVALGGSAEPLELMRGRGSAARAEEAVRDAATPLDSVVSTWILTSATGERRLTIGATPSDHELALLDSLTGVAATSRVAQTGPFVPVGDSVWFWAVVPVGPAERLEGFVVQRRRVPNAPAVVAQIRELAGRDVSLRFASVNGDVWTDVEGGPEDALLPAPLPDSTFEAVAPSGERIIGAVARVDGTPNLVVLFVPRSIVLQRPDAFRRRIMMSGLIVLIAGTVAAWLLSRHVTRPLREVSQAADAVASGDYDQRVVVERDDELGRLGDAFNVMAERIGIARTELEQRVDDSMAMSDALSELNTELRSAQHQAVRAAQAEHRARTRIERLQALTASLSENLTPDEVVRTVLEQGMQALGAAGGGVCLLTPDGTHQELAAVSDLTVPLPDAWNRFPLDGPYPVNDAVRNREIIFVSSGEGFRARYPEVARDLQPGRYEAYAAAPLEIEGRVIGAINYTFAERRNFVPEDRTFLAAIARQCAQALERARLFEAERLARADAEEVARRSAALSAASEALVGSLEMDPTLDLIVDLATRELGEYAQIFLVQGDEILRSASACTVPEKLPLLEALSRGAPHRVDGTSPQAEVIRTRQPRLVPVVTDHVFQQAATDADHLDLLRRLDWRSLIFAPLEARGSMIGLLVSGRFRAGDPFDADDVEFAVELARRAALAVDNARLYQGEQLARAAAERASRVKSDFLAVMSHELRTPLNAIIGYTSLIADEIVGPVSPAQQTQLGRVKAGARHLLSLIEQILSLSRLEAGKEEVIAERADLIAIARETAALIEPAAMTKRLRFEVKVPPPPVEITTDPTKVRQIMLNLLGNAVKFTESGFVELSIEVNPEVVEIRVTDSGEGIAAEHAERIFEPFWQVGQSRFARAAGTGLGLSVSRQLARLMGGDITVRSELGRGSTFLVRLPRALSGSPSADAAPPAGSAVPSGRHSTQ